MDAQTDTGNSVNYIVGSYVNPFKIRYIENGMSCCKVAIDESAALKIARNLARAGMIITEIRNRNTNETYEI